MTTIDGVASARPATSWATACSTVSARVQVPLRRSGGSATTPASKARTTRAGNATSSSRCGKHIHRFHHPLEVQCVLGSAFCGALNTGSAATTAPRSGQWSKACRTRCRPSGEGTHRQMRHTHSEIRFLDDGSFVARHERVRHQRVKRVGHRVEIVAEESGVHVKRHGRGGVAQHPLDGLYVGP